MLNLSQSPFVMGIVNVTPDSFSGDGVMKGAAYIQPAITQALRMVEDGANIIDIGGESSRPGAEPVSTAEELDRVIPVIESICKQSPVFVSIDTVKAEVAAAAIKTGATIINDISALSDPAMAEVAAAAGVYVVLMHNRSDPSQILRDPKLGGAYQSPAYGDIVEDVKRDLSMRVEVALKAGMNKDKIILDPGIGFGKTPAQNLALINHADSLKALGYPVLIGPSRKNFIGHVLDLPVEERLEGTAACVAVAVMRGADILRVHDVKSMARLVKMATALRES